MQENKGPMKQILGNMVKKKIWAFLAPAIPPILLFLVVSLLTLGIIFIFIYPVLKGGQIIEGAKGFFEQVANGITLKCFFCSNDDLSVQKEKKFYDKVEKINQYYLDTFDIQLDIPLLLSAVFYTEDIDQMMGSGTEDPNYDDATSGDLFGDISWYYDQGDQKSIEWYVGETYEDGCHILGYHYYTGEEGGKKSKLRQMAKHMVKKTLSGVCVDIWDEEVTPRKFLRWEPQPPIAHYELDISKIDTLYTLQFDQEPYKEYRSIDELSSLPPTFLTYLIARYFPNQYPTYFYSTVKDLSDDHRTFLSKRKNMKNIIYSMKSGYEYLVGNEYGFSNGSSCSVSNETCKYNVKSIDDKNVTIRNAKVKLLKCDGTESKEALVDFEKYIIGVLHAGNTSPPLEALKAEAIAMRGYALKNGEHNDKNLKIQQQNGQWVIPMINCSLNSQFYCDPDKGCTIDANEIYSGTKEGKSQFKKSLPTNSEIRTAVSDTTGKVLIDSSDKIIDTKYTNSNKDAWKASVENGSDAYEALVGTFGTDVRLIENNCNGCITTVSGDFTSWKQAGESWSNIPLGNSSVTIGSAGCLATSVAKVIAMSGTEVTIPKFDPGEMVKYLNKKGMGFHNGNWQWQAPQQSGLTPNFVYQGGVHLSGSRGNKAAAVKRVLDQGYYVILQVGTGNNQHWVAVTGATLNDIYMSDPATNVEKVWDRYDVSQTVYFGYYGKRD